MKKRIRLFLCYLLTLTIGLFLMTSCDNEKTVTIEAPVIVENTKTVEQGTNVDVVFNVDFKNGTLSEVNKDNTVLASSNYVINENILTMKGSYVATLLEGEYTYNLVTNGGTVQFKIIVTDTSETPPVVEAPILAESTKTVEEGTNVDVVFNVDWKNSLVTEVKNGADVLAAANYTVSENTLVIKGSYVATLLEGEYTYSLVTNGGTVQFKIIVTDTSVTPPVVEAPILTENTKTVEEGTNVDVVFNVDWKNSAVTEVKNGDEVLAAANYVVSENTLVVKGSYVVTLLEGEHTFTLVTDGGTVQFKIIVDAKPVTIWGDETEKEFDGSNDVTFNANIVNTNGLIVMLADSLLDENDYEANESGITVKASYLATLEINQEYNFVMTDGNGDEFNFVIIIPSLIQKIMNVDFENGVLPSNENLGIVMSRTINNNGIDGKSATLSGTGTLLFVNRSGFSASEHLTAPITVGRTYQYTMSFKFADNGKPTAGASNDWGVFGGNKNVVFAFLNGSGAGKYAHIDVKSNGELELYKVDCIEEQTSLTKDENGVYTFVLTFVASGDNALQFPCWNNCTFDVDNIALYKVPGTPVLSGNYMFDKRSQENLSIHLNTDGSKITEVQINGNSIDESAYTLESGYLVISAELLSTYEAFETVCVAVVADTGISNSVDVRIVDSAEAGNLPIYVTLPDGYTAEGANIRYLCDDGSELYTYKNKTVNDYNTVCDYYNSLGFEVYSTIQQGDNFATTFVGKSVMAHVYWVKYNSELNIVLSYTAADTLPAKTPEVTEGEYKTTITQIMDDENLITCGMGYVVQLSDGSFIIYDGSYSSQANKLMQCILDLHKGEGKPIIRAWLLTHSHNDHYPTFEWIANNSEYRSKIIVEHVIVSPLNDEVFALASGEQSYLSGKFYDDVKLFGSKVVFAHTGMNFTFCNLNMEILFAPESVYKNTSSLGNFNDTSIVSRLYDENYNAIFTGDMSEAGTDYMLKAYSSDYLKSNVCQVAHHGVYIGDYIVEFYDAVRAQIMFYPASYVLYEHNDLKLVNYQLEQKDYIKEILIQGLGQFTREWGTTFDEDAKLSMPNFVPKNPRPWIEVEEPEVPEDLTPVIDINFEENANDVCGNITVTTNGNITYVDALDGKGAIVGGNKYYSIPNFAPGATGFTISTWINISSMSGDPIVFGTKDWSSGGNKGFALCIEAGGARFNANVSNGLGDRVDLYATSDSYLNEWINVTLVADFVEGKWKLSVNFEEFVEMDLPSALMTANPYSGLGQLVIGQDGTGSYGSPLNFTVDKFVVFNRAATQEELEDIKALLGATNEPNQPEDEEREELTPTIDMDFEGNGNDNCENVEATANGNVTYTDAVDGKGAVVGGSDYFVIPNFVPGEDGFTISTWINISEMSGDPIIFGTKDWGSGNNIGFALCIEGDGARFNANVSNGAGERLDLYATSDSYLNEWINVTLVADFVEGKWKLSVNFEEFVEMDLPSALMTANPYSGLGQLVIGQDGTGSYGSPLNFTVDKFVVFNRAASQEELKLISSLVVLPSEPEEEKVYEVNFDFTTINSLEELDMFSVGIDPHANNESLGYTSDSWVTYSKNISDLFSLENGLKVNKNAYVGSEVSENRIYVRYSGATTKYFEAKLTYEYNDTENGWAGLFLGYTNYERQARWGDSPYGAEFFVQREGKGTYSSSKLNNSGYTEGSVPSNWNVNGEHTLTIIADETGIKFYADGTLVNSLTTEELTAKGYVLSEGSIGFMFTNAEFTVKSFSFTNLEA